MPMPEGTAMTVSSTLDGQQYVALNGGPQFPRSEAISFPIMCADRKRTITTGIGSPTAAKRACAAAQGPLRVSWQVIPPSS